MNQQVNMASMAAAGGPVGGTPMMNNAGNRGPGNMDQQVQLNTYIYDYFLKNHQYALARLVSQELQINTQGPIKPSPNQRNVNGVDDSMDTDNKDGEKRPDDLPAPAIPSDSAENSFLYDWWCQFWDIFSAQRGKKVGQPALQYLQHTRQQAQMRQNQQQQMLMSGGMQYRGMMPNGMMPTDLQKRAMANNRNPQMAAMQNMRNQQMQTQMQRDGSGMDMSGQRPSSPGSGENAPSPTKRPRLEGNAFNGQMGPGRTQGMPPGQIGATSASAAQAGSILLANGIPPGELPANQFNAFQNANPNVQKASIEVYTQNLAQQHRAALNNSMAKGMNPGMPQGSPMNQQALDGSAELFNAGGNPRMGGGPPGQAGNHALQDYQMQLMLLEQQNKKRLLMARQEQDNIATQPTLGQASIGQPGFPPGMSPQGSRPGPSPNPADQMKRGTPKMGQTGLPGSPMPDGSMQPNRSSPVPNAFDPSQMPPGMPPQYNYQMGANGMMRPPSSHPGFNPQNFTPQQMEQMRRQMPNGGWPQMGPQMMQQQQQQPQGQQPVPMGTPQQRSMPPPPAPPSGAEAQRTQPSSPSQAPAPPTPSQAPKAAPRGKKEKQETKKKPAKKGSTTTGATPVSETEPPPTPTPSTPITPMHPNSFNNQKNGAAQPANAQQPQAPAVPPVPAAPAMDPNTSAPFGAIDGSDPNFDLNFASLESADVLESFDFDSFLHTGDDNGAFGSLDSNFNFGPDSVEAGTGDL